MKMKRLYQIIDELAVGFELQLQRYREMAELSERLKNLLRSRNELDLREVQEKLQELKKEIAEAAVELEALAEEAKKILHLKELKIERLQELVNTPSSFKLGEILVKIEEIIKNNRDIDTV